MSRDIASAGRRAEQPRPLPETWRPEAVLEGRIRDQGLDMDKVLVLYRRAKDGVQLKRWTDRTFVLWYDGAVRAGELHQAYA